MYNTVRKLVFEKKKELKRNIHYSFFVSFSNPVRTDKGNFVFNYSPQRTKRGNEAALSQAR